MKKLLTLFLVALTINVSAQISRKRAVTLMGSRWDILLIDRDSASAEKNIDRVIAEVSRIENLISDWRPQTQVSQINQNAGIKPIVVDREVFELTQRAIWLSEQTNGAFDISFAAMDKIWKFDGSMTAMPSEEAIQKSVSKVGYRNIILDSIHSTIFLNTAGMKIGFGALGEGYAADKARILMKQQGVVAGIVNGSGDMSAWGKQINGTDWTIGITNPFSEGEVFAALPLKKGAVVTSGSYEKFVEFDGKRYSHIINPSTGYPATGLISVTVFGESAETANGLSTSMMVLGVDKGKELIKRYRNYEYIIITDRGTIHSSPSLHFGKRKLRRL